MRRAPPISLTREERRELLRRAGERGVRPRWAIRARIVLRAAERAENQTIARELRISPASVGLWRRRFVARGIPGLLEDAPRSGRPPTIPTSTIRAIVRASRRPSGAGAGRWSSRHIARATGVSKTTVQRVWKAHGIRARAPEASPSPDRALSFVEKITDVVGLYLAPPDRAMAFAVDPRSRGGARWAPSVGGRAPRAPHRDRAAEFRRFLQAIDRETSPGLELHLLISNLYAPATPEVGRWLVRHPRVHLHFVPAAPSGSDLIASLLGGFSRKRIGASTLPSVARLLHAVRAHAAFPADPSDPLVWIASKAEIRDRLGRPGERWELVDRALGGLPRPEAGRGRAGSSPGARQA